MVKTYIFDMYKTNFPNTFIVSNTCKIPICNLAIVSYFVEYSSYPCGFVPKWKLMEWPPIWHFDWITELITNPPQSQRHQKDEHGNDESLWGKVLQTRKIFLLISNFRQTTCRKILLLTSSFRKTTCWKIFLLISNFRRPRARQSRARQRLPGRPRSPLMSPISRWPERQREQQREGERQKEGEIDSKSGSCDNQGWSIWAKRILRWLRPRLARCEWKWSATRSATPTSTPLTATIRRWGDMIVLDLDEISYRDSSRASLVMRLRLLLSRLVMESPVCRCLLSYLCQTQINMFSSKYPGAC